MKKLGTWEIYEKNIHNSDLEDFIKDFKDFVEDQLKISNESYVNEQGDVEKWVGRPNVEKVLEGLAKTIEHLESIKSK